MRGEAVKLVGMVSPVQGKRGGEDGPRTILVVPGDVEYVIENTPVADQLRELVYEQVLVLGTVKSIKGKQHLTVTSFQPFDGLGQDEWYEDDLMGDGY